MIAGLAYVILSYHIKNLYSKSDFMNKLLISIVSIIFLGACTVSSTGRNQITLFSASELNKMGKDSFEQMKQEIAINRDVKTNQYVQCVANAITAQVPSSAHAGSWEVVVFESDQVNAFALPGGKIGVYTGILKVANDQEQLAAIIGHEVGHVLEQHSNERISSNALSQTGLAIASSVLEVKNVANQSAIMAGLGVGLQYGVLMPYGRTHETEADIVGQELMARSGFNPEASIRLWKNMASQSKLSPPEFMSTHPSSETRINQLSKHLSVSTPLFKQSKTRIDCGI